MVNRDTKYKFAIFQSTEDAIKENLHVDPYDPNLPRKHWIDPNPTVNADGECEYKVFKYVGNMVQVDPSTGQPKFTTLRISPEWAKRFNIYDPQFHNSQVPDVEKGSVPVPIRDLKEGEEWKFGFLSEPTIVKKIAQVLPVSSNVENPVLDEINEKLNRIIVMLGSK